jgi:hypothetical protein
MPKGKAFFVVGHKNWGKSTTLKALTDGSWRKRLWEIKGTEFFIRRMSNDDIPKDFRDFATRLDPKSRPYVIATMCPTFEDKRWRPHETMRLLRQSYDLFFFVLRHKCKDPEITISDGEVSQMEKYGEVKVYRNSGNRPAAIARAFEMFIRQHM